MAAGGVTLGFLKYVLGLDTLSFRKGMTDAERDLLKLQKSFENRGASFAKLGERLSLVVTAPLAALAGAGIREAQETAAAMAQVNAALTSMGPVAGRTAGQLTAAANAFEGSSLFEADQILKDVTANLLTFGNIAGKNFDLAQQAAIDLATRLGTDLQSSAILVGKALNDPVKGLTALSRAGIQFTADQKATIKAMVDGGNAAGAQAIILGELKRQFGGAAQAAQNADPYNKTRDALKNMSEAIGTALLPLLPPLTNAITTVANAFSSLSPQTQKWLIIAGGVAAALGPVLVGFGAIITVIARIAPLVTALSAAWSVLKAALIAARLAALTTLPALVPFLVPLGALALAVGAVYLTWKNWDKITGWVRGVYVGVKTWLQDKLGAVFEWVKDKVKGVGGAFFRLYDRVVGHSYVPDMVDGIAAHMARLTNVMVAPAQATTKATGDAFRALQERVSEILAELFPEAAATNEFKAKLADINEALRQQAIDANTAAAAVARLKAAYADRGVNVAAIASPLDAGAAQVPLQPTAAPTGVAGADAGLSGVQNIATQAGAALDRALGRVPQLAGRGVAAVGSLAAKFAEMAAGANAAMQNVALNGVSALADKLVGVISGTVKLGAMFRQVASQIIAELLRIQLQKMIAGFASKILGGIGGGVSGARASGGPVWSGGSFLVGEKGPEIFTPSRSGQIISNDNARRMAGRGGGGPMIGSLTIAMNGPMSDRERRETSFQAAREIQQRLSFASRGRG